MGEKWDQLAEYIETLLEEQAFSLFEDGKIDAEFFKLLAEDLARETWLGKVATDIAEREVHQQNLAHLAVTAKTRITRRHLQLKANVEDTLVAIVSTTAKVLGRIAIGALIAAV